MYKHLKIRLLPTKEQEEIMIKTINCYRFTYNWALNRCNELYKEKGKFSMGNIRKEFTQLKKQEEYKWLNEVSSASNVEAMRNLDRAFKSFFKGQKNYPKFKTKRNRKKTFYVRYDRMTFTDKDVNIEKVGRVKYKTNYIIPQCKYLNPYCSYDGKYWYLSFGIEVKENQITLNKDLSIGIDLGIKDLATCSNGMIFKNINKTTTMKRMEKRLKRLQRRVSRKYEMNKQGNKYVKTNNIIKVEKQIKMLYRRMANIRDNHIHQATNKIVKLKPYRVVMEDLNISDIMKHKGRYITKAIIEQNLYDFKEKMKYKCEWNGIKFVLADRWYPSSKTCSCCGNIKKDLKLKDRTYHCDKCGLEIDRDLNASINLSRYELA